MVLAYKIAQVCVWGGGTFLEAGRAAFKGVQRVVLAYKIAQVRGVLVVWGVLCVYGRGGKGAVSTPAEEVRRELCGGLWGLRQRMVCSSTRVPSPLSPF